MIEKIYIETGGKIYRWQGYLGSVLESFEKKKKYSVGDIRTIKGIIFYVSNIKRSILPFKKDIISWSISKEILVKTSIEMEEDGSIVGECAKLKKLQHKWFCNKY